MWRRGEIVRPIVLSLWRFEAVEERPEKGIRYGEGECFAWHPCPADLKSRGLSAPGDSLRSRFIQGDCDGKGANEGINSKGVCRRVRALETGEGLVR